MYQALYRKWRPKSFDEVFGQEHITTVLKNQVESGKISHAYLFCGSRGTGKTTCAKILAKAANCLDIRDGSPCGVCESCRSIDNGSATDVLEIDAASNNGVDNIRSLRDEVLYPPSTLRKRVYIIDEVHMLSDGAFNALLKTLEEPPEYVVFILATTEFNKIPPTILSRCQRFEFRRIDADIIIERLRQVTAEENIKIDEEALNLISRLADGALRDALSLLESCVASAGESGIGYAEAEKQLGVANNEAVIALYEYALRGDTAAAVEALDILYKGARDLSTLIEQLIFLTRDLLLMSSLPSLTLSRLKSSFCFTEEGFKRIRELLKLADKEKLLYFSAVLAETQSRMSRYSLNKKLVAEVALIKLCELDMTDSTAALAARVAALESGVETKKRGRFDSKLAAEYEAEASFENKTESESKSVAEFSDVAITKTEPAPDALEKAKDAKRKSDSKKSASKDESSTDKKRDDSEEAPFELSAELLGRLKKDIQTFSFASNAKFTVRDGLLIVTADPFTKSMLERPNSKKLFEESVEALCEDKYTIVFRELSGGETAQKSFFDEL